MVALAIIFSALPAAPVNAQGEPPSGGEPPAPVEETLPAEGDPAPESVEEPAEPPATEAPAELEPAPQEAVSEAVEELAESDIVLYDAAGEPLPLACQTTLGALTSTDPSGILGAEAHGAPAGAAFNYFRSDAGHPDGTCQYSAAANTLVCFWDKPIQQAVNDAALGSTVMVEGIHSEQVIINRQVHLAGRPGATLVAPNALPNRFYHDEGWGGGWDYPIIWVQNTQGVIVRGFTITGPSVWTVGAGNQIVGIGYTGGAGGEVYNNVIRDLRNPAGGNFFGVGVITYQADNVEIHHNEIINTDNAIEIERSSNIYIHDNLLDRSAYGAIDRGSSSNGQNTSLTITNNELTNTPRQFFGGSYKNSIITNNYNSIIAGHDNDGDDFTGTDNCPYVYNPDQADSDLDGIGDACDALPEDFEEDGFSGENDNCGMVFNPDQADSDGDGIGDACDAYPDDPDNDGFTGAADNCPGLTNPDQADADGDGVGDACDALPNDYDNDGVDDQSDNCPATVNPDQADNDQDGAGDPCDTDDDNDGAADGGDNCPLTANSDQADTDLDGTGDACDDDDDGDALADGGDNCPLTANTDQADRDRDGLGDACDDDDDGDGIRDARDSCPMTPNWNEDADDDGIDDACDPFIPQREETQPRLSWWGTAATLVYANGEPTELNCQLPYMILRLANGNQAIFRVLCGYWAIMSDKPLDGGAAQKIVPEMKYASGVVVTVLKERDPVDPLPEGGMLTVSFHIPSAWQSKELAILYWDPTLNNGQGDWMALPEQVITQGADMPQALHPENAGDLRWVYSGVANRGSRVEVTLNFSGVFVLAQK